MTDLGNGGIIQAGNGNDVRDHGPRHGLDHACASTYKLESCPEPHGPKRENVGPQNYRQ